MHGDLDYGVLIHMNLIHFKNQNLLQMSSNESKRAFLTPWRKILIISSINVLVSLKCDYIPSLVATTSALARRGGGKPLLGEKYMEGKKWEKR